MRVERSDGFSLVEALVASAIFAGVAAVLFHFAANAQRIGRAQPEVADVNQRLRVAAGMIAAGIAQAGGGDAHGLIGSLAGYFPPILPGRAGLAAPDAELTAFDDRITLVRVDRHAPPARLLTDMGGASEDLAILPNGPGCPASGFCGFLTGTRAVALDRSGVGAGFEPFTVTHTDGAIGHGPPNAPFTRLYTAATGVLLPVHHTTYYLDASTRRLMSYDGFKTAHPLVENVVSLRFEYFLDPNPSAVAPPQDGNGSCVFGPGDPPSPLLQPLPGSSLANAALETFTDGPVCGIAPRRFDGDLLRIRMVRVRLRVQAALERNRGAGADFVYAGTSRDPLGSVRDFEVTIDVAARNMRGGR